MAYRYRQEVKFRHCDPAGIVFYPRYFEMINDTTEAFFAEVLHYPFSEMHRNAGIPTARIETEFLAPSRLGDVLEIVLSATRLGRSSLDLAFEATCGAERRFTARSTIVHIDASGRSQPWGDAVRAILTEEVKGVSDGT